MMKMTLEDAEKILGEIAMGDQEKDAYETLVYACEQYRTMYEGMEKRLALYRDIATMPDIPENPTASHNPPDSVDAQVLNATASKK